MPRRRHHPVITYGFAFEKAAAIYPEMGTVYYVDNVNGNDAFDGLQFDNAKATIQSAITASNATINWSYTPKQYNYIYVKPGVYAENLTPAYYCIIQGLGIRGTDTAAEIHPTTGSCFTGTFLGTVLRNLRMESNVQDTPILNLGVCNNSLIEDCEFALGANVTGVAAIDTDNCTHLVVKNCDFTSGQLQAMAYAAYHRGGSNKFAHNVRYLDNRIWALTAGIWVQSTCTSSGMLVEGNTILMEGGIGIDINDTNTHGCAVIGNKIGGVSGVDAIDHSGGAHLVIDNEVNIAGTTARETAHA